jgi:hypothetical protein
MHDEGGAPLTPGTPTGAVESRRNRRETLRSSLAIEVIVAALFFATGQFLMLFLDPAGQRMIRLWTNALTVGAVLFVFGEGVLATVTNRRWVRSAEFERLALTSSIRWSRIRVVYGGLLRFQFRLGLISLLAVGALVFGAGAVFVPLLVDLGVLSTYLCLRYKRDQCKRILSAPRSVRLRRRGDSDPMPAWVETVFLNPMGTVGASRAVWYLATFVAVAVPFAFGAYDGATEVSALATHTGKAAVAVFEAVTPDDSDPQTPESTVVTTSSQPEVMDADFGSRVVRRGDSFWSIADEVLTAAFGVPQTPERIYPYWQRLVEENQKLLVEAGNPDLIIPGQIVRTPPVDVSGELTSSP